MDTSIRELKAHLSEYIRRAAGGEDVTVTVHGRAVARIVAAAPRRDLRALASEPGISWAGGKPDGLARPQALTGPAQISEWVAEDRR
jgi:prevent-host-death family protein